MVGTDHADRDAAGLLGAAEVHSGSPRRSLGLEVAAQVVVRDHHRVVLASERQCVGHVVGVRMGDENEVEAVEPPAGGRTGRIPLEPRVDDHRLAAREIDPQRRVSEPGEAGGSLRHGGTSLPSKKVAEKFGDSYRFSARPS